MEEPEYGVLLTGAGEADRKLDVVRALRSVTGLSAWRSSRLLDSVPLMVMEDVSLGVAEDAARLLEAAGAGARVRCTWSGCVFAPGSGPGGEQPCTPPDWSAEGCPPARRALRR
ncbi:ribosomal protein L7/L12 [Actinacidiphila glaucinigra]|uniref:Ribosomal protein L7/L12 C-terminal domain-containing protein n=1 Tax=Actinacidiphila glaucinigra TaxID=235986 RepID=A0A239N2L9_9ACTN|nr:ribosomal protein L7/L12 [Actinacidiphila glaucinigra]SNT48723.1 Ribosomal protein L7/L12 C-terminal domain-containing protein [Actinacidiphila glaucinigra]